MRRFHPGVSVAAVNEGKASFFNSQTFGRCRFGLPIIRAVTWLFGTKHTKTPTDNVRFTPKQIVSTYTHLVLSSVSRRDSAARSSVFNPAFARSGAACSITEDTSAEIPVSVVHSFVGCCPLFLSIIKFNSQIKLTMVTLFSR